VSEAPRPSRKRFSAPVPRPAPEPAPARNAPAEAPASRGLGAGVPVFLRGPSASAQPRPVAEVVVGTPGDALERQAEEASERAAAPCGAALPPPRMPQGAAPGVLRVHAPEAARAIAAPGPGSPLPDDVRAPLEAELGGDLSELRVHGGLEAAGAARALGARAFAYGPHVWLGAGESARDLRLMAHEAAHVLQQRGGPAVVRRQSIPGAPSLPAPAPGMTPMGPPAPAPPTPVPAAPAGAPSGPAPLAPGTTELVIPPRTLVDAEEESWTIAEASVEHRLWDAIVELPPPLFFATVGLTARLQFRLEMFLRYGPVVLRDIRLAWNPAESRYSGTAQLFVPVSGGPRAILTGTLAGSAEWLGLLEAVRVEGSLRATGQAPLIVAAAPSVAVQYDDGDFTLNARPQVEAGFALLFDLDALARVVLGGDDEVWAKTWRLFHWQWGHAVRAGASFSLDYENGELRPVRTEPFAERFPIDELLDGLRAPAEDGAVTLIPPGRRPAEERLRELLGTEGTDPQVILAALAEATDAEKAALLGDEAMMGAVDGAVGEALRPVARRILTRAPSETVPSLDEGTVFTASRHIRLRRFADALAVVVERLQANGTLDPGLATFRYQRSVSAGEGLTETDYDEDPATGARTPRPGGSTVSIYDPAFVGAPWLFSTVMHEYVHVLQHQRTFTSEEWVDPDASDAGEVEAYLWEVEHARGTGVLASSAQMEEVGRRLTDHFQALSPAGQARYQARYDDAMARVRDAASGVLPVNLAFSVDEARRGVQESSERIAGLMRQRPLSRTPTPDERRRQEEIDAQVAALQRDRAGYLVEVVLAENPNVQIVDRVRGMYRVPVTDGAGQVRWLTGSISVVWHLHQVSPSVFDIGARIQARPPDAALPPGTAVTHTPLVGGSGIQSTVQPYPGDIDFGEEYTVTAPDAAAAGQAMAAVVVEFVNRTRTEQDFEFVRLAIYPVTQQPGKDYAWPAARVLNPANHEELASQLADLGGGRANTFWRALIAGGRFIEITKVLGIHALATATGKTLFGTDWMGAEFQEAYMEEPPEIESVALGEYAGLMRRQAIELADKGAWLKAAKRSFNYLRAIGNLQGMTAIQPVFSTTQAQLNQHLAVMEATARTLDPAAPTRVLTAEHARELLNTAAGRIRADMPPPDGPRVATDLEGVAARVRGNTDPPVGMVAPDRDLLRDLKDRAMAPLQAYVDRSLEARVRPVVDRYVR
jgi:hypothetical protein